MKGWGEVVSTASFAWSLTVTGQVTSAPLLSEALLKWGGGQLQGHRKGLLKMAQHLATTEQRPDGPLTQVTDFPISPAKKSLKRDTSGSSLQVGHHH